MERIQRPEVTEALVKQFGLRGRPAVGLDSVVVPTSNVGDFDGRSPWESRLIGAGYASQVAGGAARYGGVAFTPATNTVLVVEAFFVTNVTGANHNMRASLENEATLLGGAVTITATSRLIQLNGEVLPGAGIPRVGATARAFHANAILSVNVFDIYYVPNVQHWRQTPPRGIVLDGRDRHVAAPLSLVLQIETANVGTPSLGVYVTEYR